MVDVFETLPHEELTNLAELCKPTEYRAGEVIFHTETASDRVYVLEQGRVRIYRTGPRDQEMTLAVLAGGPGFGGAGFRGWPPRACGPGLGTFPPPPPGQKGPSRVVLWRTPGVVG